MDVYISEMRSTVRAVDGDSLLTPELLDRIVRAVLARLVDERDRDRRGEADRVLHPDRVGSPDIEPTGGGS
jgi:hypothetical protein